MATQSNGFYLIQQAFARPIKVRAWDRRRHSWILPQRLVCATSGDLLVRALDCHCYEISQFTGRKDHNGRDIYEGDFVRTSYHGWRMLAWNVRGLWVMIAMGHYQSSMTIGLWELQQQEIEVIGNRFENPGLATQLFEIAAKGPSAMPR